MCLYLGGSWRLAENNWDLKEACVFTLALGDWVPFSAASHSLQAWMAKMISLLLIIWAVDGSVSSSRRVVAVVVGFLIF